MKPTKKHWIVSMMLLALLAVAGAACSQKPGALTIQDAWARPGQAGGTSAVYMTIQNSTGQADSLVDAKCTAAMMTQVHKTTIDAAGKASMAHQPSVEIPNGQATKFEPGGLHIMLMNLKQELKAGEKITVTLTFAKAGEMQFDASVREP